MQWSLLFQNGVIKGSKVLEAQHGNGVRGGGEEVAKREIGKWSGGVEEQTGCDFLMKLPGEVRNWIYGLVFRGVGVGEEEEEEKEKEKEGTQGYPKNTDATKPRSKPAHVLSLLLSCRRIHNEAACFAFSTHVFTLTQPYPFHALRQRVAPLPAPLAAAITSLAFRLDDGSPSTNALTTCNDRAVCAFMTHAILLFPGLASLVVKTTLYRYNEHDRRQRILERHVAREPPPQWFQSACVLLKQGASCKWQEGEKWSVRYPGSVHAQDVFEGSATVAGGQDEGNEGDAAAAAVLEQESGRRIRVYLQFEIADNARGFLHKVRLVPGIKAVLPVMAVNEGVVGRDGFIWDADEEYWDGLRWQNQRLGVTPRQAGKMQEWCSSVRKVVSCHVAGLWLMAKE
ncbi:hypothetical protein ACN47E_000396 [Coniothyrium glycines]